MRKQTTRTYQTSQNVYLSQTKLSAEMLPRPSLPQMDFNPSLTFLTRAIFVRASAHKSMACSCKCACIFFSAELSTARYMMHKLLYLISFCCLHAISPFCASQLISLAHLDLTISPSPLPFHTFLSFFNSPLPFPPFFLNLQKRISAYNMCCPLLSFFPVSAVIQRSACQLSKKTLRSMVITSPFDNLSTSSVLCRPFAFFYI